MEKLGQYFKVPPYLIYSVNSFNFRLHLELNKTTLVSFSSFSTGLNSKTLTIKDSRPNENVHYFIKVRKMRAVDIIANKKNGKVHSREELEFWINGIVKNENLLNKFSKSNILIKNS